MLNISDTPMRSEGKPATDPGPRVKDLATPVVNQLQILKSNQRTAFFRNLRHMQNTGVLNGTTQNTSLVDLLLGSDNKGLPIATIEHSISTKSIVELSLGLGSALVLSGLILKK